MILVLLNMVQGSIKRINSFKTEKNVGNNQNSYFQYDFDNGKTYNKRKTLS